MIHLFTITMSATTGLPYVPLQAFPTNAPATGGDSLTEDLNVYYKVNDLTLLSPYHLN